MVECYIFVNKHFNFMSNVINHQNKDRYIFGLRLINEGINEFEKDIYIGNEADEMKKKLEAEGAKVEIK